MDSPEGVGPEQMRAAMAAYVRGLHQAYLDAADLVAPGDRAALPLLCGDTITVAAVGTRVLHIIATTDRLPAPQGQEVSIDDELPGLRWSLRFYDPVIIPALGLVDENESPAFTDVRRHLGIHSVLYHLAVPPGASLTPHHAAHGGTGLAHGHLEATRDFEAIRAYSPGREGLVDEMHSAHRTGLHRAHALLARELVPEVTEFDIEPPSDPAVVRRLTLQALRPGGSVQR